MKLKFSAIVVLVFATSQGLLAQTTYKQIFSDPTEVYPGYLALHYFGIDAGLDNTAGASLWSLGAETLYPVTDKLRAEGVFLYSLFSMEKSGPAFLFNGGVEYSLSTKTKKKTVPVLLAFSNKKDYTKGVETSTYTTVKLPGDITNELNARGGLYLKSSAFEYENNGVFFDITNIFHAGVYAGIGLTRKLYMHVQDSDGYTFAYARQLRPFFDLLIMPTSVDVKSGGARTTVEENMGWRAGVTWQMNPITEKENFNNKIGFFGNLLYRIEVGQRPLEGVFVTTSIGWAIKKFK